ncbi:MAG: hypothetical protein ACYSWP_00140 [Planctomycetota bacterium]
MPTVKMIEVNVSGGQETHPTAGYRRWSGMAVAAEPIVALAMIENDECYSWVRSSTRQESLEMGILFSPYDTSGKDICVSFAIGNSLVRQRCSVPSQQTEPNPVPGVYQTGTIIRFAELQSIQPVVLHVLFLAKVDVKMLRCGIWHLKVAHKDSLDDIWRRVLTFGRTGIVEKGR